MRAPVSWPPILRQIAVILWLAMAGAACNPHAPSSPGPPLGVALELKVYPSSASAQKRALSLSVTAFRAMNAIGAHYPGGGHRWLVVDARGSRLPGWNPP